MHDKYEFWEVCKDDAETQGVLCISSIYGQEWIDIAKVKKMNDDEINAMLLEDISLYEIVKVKKIDKRKIKSAVKELKRILNLY